MGVHNFAGRAPSQTIPVSHFGDIDHAKIWLILTNPKGDRNDPNVGHLVSLYDANNRSTLSKVNVEEIFKHFSSYFDRPNVHQFFAPFMRLLDNLVVAGHHCTFQNGGVCAVDLIKCPTIVDWQQYVRTNEGKKVWDNCLGRVRAQGSNHFITRQIQQHQPLVLIFAQSTYGLVGSEYKGNSQRVLNSAISLMAGGKYISNVFLLENPKRISIGLHGTRMMNNCFASPTNMKALHDTLQHAINKVF